jgi:hypothetical protein
VQQRSGQPWRACLITTLALTAPSFTPDLTADATTATKLTLVRARLAAAAVIIPALAARLTAARPDTVRRSVAPQEDVDARSNAGRRRNRGSRWIDRSSVLGR